MSKQSRLEEISRKRSVRNTIFILMGIIILIVVFFFYGIPLLINFSLFIERLGGGNDPSTTVNALYIAPPVFDPLQDATNSAQITVSGSALPNQTVKIYVNGKYISQSTVGDNKNFIFNNVTLDPGDNTIKAKSVSDQDKESSYSQDIHISFINKAPDLEINSPQNNQAISSGDAQIKVEGKTNPGVRVTINGYWAIVDNQANFSYLLRLQKGENKIKAVASDDAGNQTSKEITVSLNQ
jgi:hypothetical protein